MIKHLIYLASTLGLFWLMLSGHYTGFMFGCAAASLALTLFVAWRMDVVDDEAEPIHLTGQIFVYWLWLAWEVAKANLDVCRRIWSPRLDISPTMVCLTANQKTPLGVMLYANSITVTPGTVCVNVEGDKLEVHALTWSAAEDLLEGEMDRRVCQLEI